MGFIADLVAGAKAGPPKKFPGQDESRRIWREVFATAKEDGGDPRLRGQVRNPQIGQGGYGRSIAGQDAAVKRLKQAFRSMAPGGWSDDRWEQSRHQTGIVFAAVTRLCKQFARTQVKVYKKDPASPNGQREVTEDDPPEGGRIVKPYDLVKLLKRPNKQDSWGKWMYRLMQQKLLTGMGLNWMVFSVAEAPKEMYIIPTAMAIPQPAINPDFPDGYYRIQPIYPYGPFSSYPTPTTAVGAPVDARTVMRFLDPHPLLRYDGYSTLTGMRYEIDEFEMIGKSRHYKMRRSINPSGVLNFGEVEGMQQLPEDELDRIHAEWEAAFQGPENAGRLIVTTNGGKLEEFGSSPKEMDYPQGWGQLADFIAGAGFGITKPAMGMVEDSSYSTLYATLKQLDLITIGPECEDIGNDLTHFLAPFFGDDLIIEVKGVRIDDHEVNFQKVDKLASLKGLPKTVIRESLRLLDIPIDEEMVEELSQAGQEQGMGMPGMGGAPGGEQPGGMEEGILGAEVPEEAQPSPPEVEASRPNPGGLSEGSLGPRKSLHALLNGRAKFLNGNGVHHQEPVTVQPVFNVSIPPAVNNITVQVPRQEAPRVTVKPPNFTLRIPRTPPPKVVVQPSTARVHVDVPQQPTPKVDVSVNVPEAAPPVVHVDAPKPRTTTKSIEYDQYGRPAQITERESSE